MADGHDLCLVLFIGVFTLTHAASVTEKFSPHVVSFTLGQLSSKVESLESRLEASLKKNRNTKTALEAAISSQKIQLEANLKKTKTALEADIFNLKTKLAAKRCESGYEIFWPYQQTTYSDARMQTKHVTFSQPFPSVPKVTAGITLLDADHKRNVRTNLDVNNLRASGVDFAVKEWSNSRTFRVGIRWMACSN